MSYREGSGGFLYDPFKLVTLFSRKLLAVFDPKLFPCIDSLLIRGYCRNKNTPDARTFGGVIYSC